MRYAALVALAMIAACNDDTQRFLFVSSDGVRAANVDTDCDCDLEVFANGACEHWTDTGPLCGCLSVGPSSLEVVRDGVVVAASEPTNPSFVRGDFAGAQVRLLVEHATYTLDLPAVYPPPRRR